MHSKNCAILPVGKLIYDVYSLYSELLPLISTPFGDALLPTDFFIFFLRFGKVQIRILNTIINKNAELTFYVMVKWIDLNYL